MKTKTVTLYTYDELPTERAKERARDWALGFALPDDWWEHIYEDANTIGLKIKSFDLDRNRHAKGVFLEPPTKVADLIIKNHGKCQPTTEHAEEFLRKLDALVSAAPAEGNREEVEDLESEFLKTLLEDYASILQNECDYLQSKEVLEETLRSNEYTFNEDGRRED